MRAYPQLRSLMSESSHKAQGWELVVMPPPYVGLPLDSRPPTFITASRTYRTASCAFLVWWSRGRMTLPRPGTPAEVQRGTNPAVDNCVVRRRTTGRRDRAGPCSATGRGPLLGGRLPGGRSVAFVVYRVIVLCLSPLRCRRKTVLLSCTTNPFSFRISVPINHGDLETQSREARYRKRPIVTPREIRPESHEIQQGVTRPWRFRARARRPHRSQRRMPTHSRSRAGREWVLME